MRQIKTLVCASLIEFFYVFRQKSIFNQYMFIIFLLRFWERKILKPLKQSKPGFDSFHRILTLVARHYL